VSAGTLRTLVAATCSRPAISLAAILTLTLLAGCGNHSEVAQAGQKPAAIAVQTTRPVRNDVSRLISLPADLLPWQDATLYSKVPGTLDRLLVDKGDSVKAGQLLAVIRAPEIGADMAQAEQNYHGAAQAAAASRMATLKADAETARSRAAAEKALADYGQTPATVSRAKALLQQAVSARQRAEAQKQAAEAAAQEARSQTAKSRAGLAAAESDLHLAQITYDRYNGILQRNEKLIARQQVDEAESRRAASESRVEAAKGDVEAAQDRERAAQAQVAVASRQIEEAGAGVEAARRQVEIAQAQGGSLQKQAETAKRDVDVAARQRDAVRAQERQAALAAEALRSAETRSAAVEDFTHIRAPFAGIVSKRLVDPGAFIQTASSSQNAQPLLAVADVSRLRLDIHVPETEASHVRPGTPIEIVQSDPDAPSVKTRVSRTTGVLDPGSRTLLAEVDVPNAGRVLLPGGYVIAKVTLDTHHNVVSLPSAAIGSDKSGKFVYVVEGGKAKRKPITVGFDSGKETEVEEGLSGAEEVVVTGRDALTPGAPVTTSPWTPKKRTR
jgi:HlyD family secretion protein